MVEVRKLCSVCKQNKPVSEFGPELRRPSKLKYLCRECDVERHRVQYFNTKDPAAINARRQKHSEYARARFDAKRARGECLFCLKPAAKPSTQCEEHLEKSREREKKRRARLGIIGLCTRCGKNPQSPSLMLCADCLKSGETKRRIRPWKYAPAGYDGRAAERLANLKVKDECYQAYGGYKCICCGETEPIFLTIDHVNGDGSRHRREVVRTSNIHRWLKRHGYPEGFQVLCWNCNSGRHRNGGICPHKSVVVK